MKTHTLKTPCCDKEVEFEAVLRVTEWASNVPQWDFWQWNYYRCPHCQTPSWFGYNGEGGWFGIYGAAPVADLIPISRVAGIPIPEIGVNSVTFQYRGVGYEIHRGKSYWKNT
ncbi:hypothetical protein [Gallaecimonas xiamenensis]|uniref:hypothetical protein n=1 Tax=Gallaecimonas xiamenensis TaxID=1207039 RepID=UPI0012EA67D4|nr:hypothetical protein [Gallaecimonas xiamenensis]